jgi:hypothetical protein
MEFVQEIVTPDGLLVKTTKIQIEYEVCRHEAAAEVHFRRLRVYFDEIYWTWTTRLPYTYSKKDSFYKDQLF